MNQNNYQRPPTNKFSFNNKERWLTTFHDIPQMLPIYRVLDRLVECINHKSVTIKDIRSVILSPGSREDHYNYNVLFRDTETHRLITDLARFNSSENYLYYLLDRGEIMRVTVPSTLNVIKKECIVETMTVRDKLYTTQIQQNAHMTIRSFARLVEDAISHYNIFTTSSLEIGSRGWNLKSSYVGFYKNEIREKFEKYVRESCNMNYSVIAKQSLFTDYTPLLRVQAKKVGLLQQSSDSKEQAGSEDEESEERSTTPPLHLASPSAERLVEEPECLPSTSGTTQGKRDKFVAEKNTDTPGVRKEPSSSKGKKSEKEQIKGLLKLVRTGKFRIILAANDTTNGDSTSDSSD